MTQEDKRLISTLALPQKVHLALRHAGIDTVGALIRESASSLRGYRGIGDVSIFHIEGALTALGLLLKEKPRGEGQEQGQKGEAKTPQEHIKELLKEKRDLSLANEALQERLKALEPLAELTNLADRLRTLKAKTGVVKTASDLGEISFSIGSYGYLEIGHSHYVPDCSSPRYVRLASLSPKDLRKLAAVALEAAVWGDEYQAIKTEIAPAARTVEVLSNTLREDDKP